MFPRPEKSVQLNERELKLIVDTIPALAWSGRPDGSAEFFNQHFLDYVGLSYSEPSTQLRLTAWESVSPSAAQSSRPTVVVYGPPRMTVRA